MYDLNFNGYFYHAKKREFDELSDFCKKLSEKTTTIEELQVRPDISDQERPRKHNGIRVAIVKISCW